MQNRTIFGGDRTNPPSIPPSPPKKKMGHFIDAALPQKQLEFYNLAATNAILMKLTTIMYVYSIFHLAKDWGASLADCTRTLTKKLWKWARNSVFWLNFLGFLRMYKKPYYIWCVTLRWITVEIFVQIGLTLGE